MKFLYVLRYFQVVAVVPPLFIAGFVITIGAATIRLTSDPSAAVDALTPVLLLQLFAASSGFQVPARRGYYDLLLTSGVPRWQVAIAHCLASVLPGLAAWLCVGLLEMAASHGSSLLSVSLGTCLAFIGASLLAWSATIALSRATAAVGWLLLMTIPPVARVASPLQLVGVSLARPAPVAVATAVTVAIPVAIACLRIARGAVPLEGSQ